MRDKPRMQFGKARIKGQMDCIDESTNTDAFLRYIQSQGWLKYHTVARRTSRGAFFDGRYPHWTAVIEDKQESAGRWIPGTKPVAGSRISCRFANGSGAVTAGRDEAGRRFRSNWNRSSQFAFTPARTSTRPPHNLYLQPSTRCKEAESPIRENV